MNNIIQIDKVYGSLEEQKSVIKILIQIEDTRKLLIEEEKIQLAIKQQYKISPGRARTLAFSSTQSLILYKRPSRLS